MFFRNLLGSTWVSREALEGIVLEKLVDVEFKKFIAAVDRIATHPYGYMASDFLDKYRTKLMAEAKQLITIEPKVGT